MTASRSNPTGLFIVRTADREVNSTGRPSTKLLIRFQIFILSFCRGLSAKRFRRSGVQYIGNGSSFMITHRAKSVLFGKYCRRRPFVFSFVPRRHGLCGSAKKTTDVIGSLFATVPGQ